MSEPAAARSRGRLELVDWAPPERDPVTGRRTVTIRGQAAPRPRPTRAVARHSARPDRVAMYAFLLGLLLVLMAIVTQQ